MATTKSKRARRAWGSVDPETTSVLYARVPDDAKAVYDSIADATGVSLAVVLTEISKHLELDEQGRPVWWPSADQGDAAQGVFEIPHTHGQEGFARRSA